MGIRRDLALSNLRLIFSISGMQVYLSTSLQHLHALPLVHPPLCSVCSAGSAHDIVLPATSLGWSDLVINILENGPDLYHAHQATLIRLS